MVLDKTFWLTLTNTLLGTLVVACLLFCGAVCLHEVVNRLRRRRRYEAELNQDMREMFAPPDAQNPALGTAAAHPAPRFLGTVRARWRLLLRHH